LQRGEAVQRGQAQRIDTADDGCVDAAQFELAGSGGKDLGARRAGRRNRHRHALQPEIVAGEFGQREGIVRRAVVEIVGQRAALRIAPAVGQFGLQDAGRAGAEEDADPCLAVAGNGRAHPVGEAVGFQAHLRQAVVAAVVMARAAGSRSLSTAGTSPIQVASSTVSKAQGSRPLRPW
jgi:hypothetical protein